MELEVESGWPCVEVSSFAGASQFQAGFRKKAVCLHTRSQREHPQATCSRGRKLQFILLDMSPMSQGTQDFLPVSVGGAGCPVSSRRCQCFRSVSKVGVSLTGRQALHLFREIGYGKGRKQFHAKEQRRTATFGYRCRGRKSEWKSLYPGERQRKEGRAQSLQRITATSGQTRPDSQQRACPDTGVCT